MNQPRAETSSVSRLVGVLSYAGTPGRKTNEYNRRTFYGRSD